MELVLVSGCLLGQAVRYNGSDKLCNNNILQRWVEEGRVVSVCPEVAGGLGVPRLPAEISNGLGGLNVIIGIAKVIDSASNEVTKEFVKGAEFALELAKSKNIKIAVLKEGSPSCGTNFIYDGTFAGRKVFDVGVTTALLQRAGIKVFSENQLEEANKLLKQLEIENIVS
jgi:uncharacterized protein YbbK (DUF523 family)